MRKLSLVFALLLSNIGSLAAQEGSCIDDCVEDDEYYCDSSDCPAEAAEPQTVTTCMPIVVSSCSYSGDGGYDGPTTTLGCTPTVTQSCTSQYILVSDRRMRANRRRRANRETPPAEIIQNAVDQIAETPAPTANYTAADWLNNRHLVPPAVRELYQEQIRQLADLMHGLQDQYEQLSEQIADLNTMTPEEMDQMVENIFNDLRGVPTPEPDIDDQIADSAADTGPTREELEDQQREIAEQLADAMLRYQRMRDSLQDWLNRVMVEIMTGQPYTPPAPPPAPPAPPVIDT